MGKSRRTCSETRWVDAFLHLLSAPQCTYYSGFLPASPYGRMDECIDSLGDAQFFSTLDCNSGYWQIPVDPADRAKTTFTSHEGLYWFRRMPFGLRNAPATFQRFVDITLAGLAWKSCLVYLDDIIVFSNTKEEHLEQLDAVLGRLYRAGLSLNLK